MFVLKFIFSKVYPIQSNCISLLNSTTQKPIQLNKCVSKNIVKQNQNCYCVDSCDKDYLYAEVLVNNQMFYQCSTKSCQDINPLLKYRTNNYCTQNCKIHNLYRMGQFCINSCGFRYIPNQTDDENYCVKKQFKSLIDQNLKQQMVHVCIAYILAMMIVVFICILIMCYFYEERKRQGARLIKKLKYTELIKLRQLVKLRQKQNTLQNGNIFNPESLENLYGHQNTDTIEIMEKQDYRKNQSVIQQFLEQKSDSQKHMLSQRFGKHIQKNNSMINQQIYYYQMFSNIQQQNLNQTLAESHISTTIYSAEPEIQLKYPQLYISQCIDPATSKSVQSSGMTENKFVIIQEHFDFEVNYIFNMPQTDFVMENYNDVFLKCEHDVQKLNHECQRHRIIYQSDEYEQVQKDDGSKNYYVHNQNINYDLSMINATEDEINAIKNKQSQNIKYLHEKTKIEQIISLNNQFQRFLQQCDLKDKKV